MYFFDFSDFNLFSTGGRSVFIILFFPGAHRSVRGDEEDRLQMAGGLLDHDEGRIRQALQVSQSDLLVCFCLDLI